MVSLTWAYLSFWQLKHLKLIPFDRSLTCAWDFSIPNLITLDSQDRLDLMCMHTILFNIFSKYALCNNHVTPINLSLLVRLNSITRTFTKIFLIINWGHKILKILIIVWHLYWEAECHLHNYLIVSVIALIAPLSSQCLDNWFKKSRIHILQSLAMNLILKFPLKPHLIL
jgi:hypothetical protein